MYVGPGKIGIGRWTDYRRIAKPVRFALWGSEENIKKTGGTGSTSRHAAPFANCLSDRCRVCLSLGLLRTRRCLVRRRISLLQQP